MLEHQPNLCLKENTKSLKSVIHKVIYLQFSYSGTQLNQRANLHINKTIIQFLISK